MLENLILNYMKDKVLKYSVVIKDFKDGEECLINEEKVVPSASVIKLFIMGKVFQLVNKGELSLTQRVDITKEDRVPYSIIYFLDNENTYTIRDLVILMIIQSDNTATNKLIGILGMENINKFIKDIGLKNTVLNRKMMDFQGRKAGKDNYTTAKDVATYLELIYRRQLINKKYSEEMLEIMKMQLDGAMMRINLDDDIVIAHKTGDLPFIKHDAAIVFTEYKDYLFIMFTWEAISDRYGRNIIGKVSEISYDYFIERVSCH